MGVVKNVIVSQFCGKWYISIQIESEVLILVYFLVLMIGLDVGVVKFVMLLDGIVFEFVNSFQKNQKKLVRFQ